MPWSSPSLKRVTELTVATSEGALYYQLPETFLPKSCSTDYNHYRRASCLKHNAATHGIADMIFAARQVQEKCHEQRRDLYFAFIDLTKAFDSVNRDVLWGCLAHIGCLPKCVYVTRKLHENMKGRALHGGDQLEPFNINTSVKQGCVIAPTLFSSKFLATFLSQSKIDLAKGMDITYRTDGGVFKLSHLRAKSKVKTVTIVDLQYVDDCVVVAH